MACHGNNATPPSPAVAPGAEALDTRAVARSIAVDPRIPAVVPGFDAPFFQAGLAGYSDAPMRIVARRLGCPCCVTEALLDRTLLAGGRGFAKADLGELHDNVPGGDEDHPLVGQIMGSDPAEMAAAALKMVEQDARGSETYRSLAYTTPGRFPSQSLTADPTNCADPSVFSSLDASTPRCLDAFQAIDVNLACPVKKVSSRARGGHWLREPGGAIDILRAVRDAVPAHIPTTVKLRRGYDDSDEAERNFMRIFDAAYDLGYAWATVHGRTVEQRYLGPSRWTFLRDLVKQRPNRVVFGSGDVWDVHDIFRMIAYTGVHAVSVARGCIGNPWIFRQARQLMAGEEPTPPTLDEQRDVLESHFELAVAVQGAERATRTMRKFGIRFAEHHPRAEDVRVRFISAPTADAWREVIRDCYAPSTDPAPALL